MTRSQRSSAKPRPVPSWTQGTWRGARRCCARRLCASRCCTSTGCCVLVTAARRLCCTVCRALAASDSGVEIDIEVVRRLQRAKTKFSTFIHNYNARVKAPTEVPDKCSYVKTKAKAPTEALINSCVEAKAIHIGLTDGGLSTSVHFDIDCHTVMPATCTR